MVRFDEVVEWLWQVVFFGEFDAVFDVADDDEDAECWVEFAVSVEAWGLVFDEVFWFVEFSDVVVECSNVGEE